LTDEDLSKRTYGTLSLGEVEASRDSELEESGVYVSLLDWEFYLDFLSMLSYSDIS